VVYDYLFRDVPEIYKLTHFIFLNVGSHGKAKTREDLSRVRDKFHVRYELLSAFPNEIGIDFIPLDSNLHLFHYPWGHQTTHSLTTIAGVLFFQGLFRRYYIASAGLTYGEIMESGHMYTGLDMAMFDPQLLPLLSTESLELIPDGQQSNRMGKTLLVVDYSPAQRFLNVCIAAESLSVKNCSVCKKCVRTLAMLRIIGVEDEFKEVFDITKYINEKEKKFFARLSLGLCLGVFQKQMVDYAKSHNVSLRLHTTVYHIFMEILGLPIELLIGKLRKIEWVRSLFHRVRKQFTKRM
ncbi:hypothetical protein LCGC14_2172160, partial [marine sediment metagenome]